MITLHSFFDSADSPAWSEIFWLPIKVFAVYCHVADTSSETGKGDFRKVLGILLLPICAHTVCKHNELLK